MQTFTNNLLHKTNILIDGLKHIRSIRKNTENFFANIEETKRMFRENDQVISGQALI